MEVKVNLPITTTTTSLHIWDMFTTLITRFHPDSFFTKDFRTTVKGVDSRFGHIFDERLAAQSADQLDKGKKINVTFRLSTVEQCSAVCTHSLFFG